jgi:hypothetical protein
MLIWTMLWGCRPNVNWNQCDSERDSTDASVQIFGIENSDGLGQSVVVGDIDGDKQDDLVVGVPNFDPTPSQSNAGRVLVFLGTSLSDGATLSASEADLIIDGTKEMDGLGSSLGMSDWDDDGNMDLWLGAHQAEGNGQDSGVIYWFSSATLLSKLGKDAMTAADADVQFHGEAAYDYAGFSMSTAGDVDGDKVDDWLIGAYQADTEEKDRGKAYLLLSSDRDTWSGTVSLSDASSIFVGEAVNDYAGYSVSGGVDIDRDGLDDILIGSGNHDGYEEDSGVVYLFLGASIQAGTMSMGEADLKLYGEMAGDWAGRTVLAIPRLDRNKRGDIAVSSSWYDGDSNNVGAVYLLKGKTLWNAMDEGKESISLSQSDLKIVGDSQEMFFGQTLTVGNLDGDRYSDLLIGSPLYDDGSNADAGVIHVLLGDTLKDAWNTPLSSDALSHSIVGAAAYDSLGISMAIGDLDGDRRGDLILGTPYADDGDMNAGGVSIFFECEN